MGRAGAHDFLLNWSTHRAVIAKTQLSFLRKIASFHVCLGHDSVLRSDPGDRRRGGVLETLPRRRAGRFSGWFFWLAKFLFFHEPRSSQKKIYYSNGSSVRPIDDVLSSTENKLQNRCFYCERLEIFVVCCCLYSSNLGRGVRVHRGGKRDLLSA